MLLKKSTLAICSSSNLPTFVWPFASITSPCNPKPRPTTSPEASLSRRHGVRTYATIGGGGPKPSSDSPRSQHEWPRSPHPSPYQIFDQKRGAEYSKARFYELVKIYHPDRHRHVSGDTLTLAHRLERYRLVVAANEILSDPVKRRAYDLYGAGWSNVLHMDNAAFREAEHRWRNEPGNPSMNATWEDWERWHEQRAGDGTKKKQQTVFMSNELFAVILCAFVLMGSIGQAKRASTNSISLVEMRDQRHGAISEDMTRKRTQQDLLNRRERVESFLRRREGWKVASSNTSQQKHDEQSK